MTHSRIVHVAARPLHGVLLALPLAMGCFRLAREASPLRQYVLGGLAPDSGSAMRGGLAVAFRRIDIASYLVVPSVLVRRGTNEIAVSEYHRWGEDVGEAINRVVAGNLTGRPPVRTADIAPWATRTRHDYLVQLHIARFEGVTDSTTAPSATEGPVHGKATWDIIRPSDGLILIRGSSDDRSGTWRIGDYATLVSSLDTALLQLARDIGGCLARFRNDSTPPATCTTVTTAKHTERTSTR